MSRVAFATCLVAVMIAAMGVAGTNGVMVASHRADWRFAPENSLESLKNAIRFGAAMIETDVRMTKDGHICAEADADYYVMDEQRSRAMGFTSCEAKGERL